MKIPIFKNRTLSRETQKELRPRKEFIERGRERFLAAFDASPLAAGARAGAYKIGKDRRSYAALFAKIAIGIVAVLCVATGFSVYADTANVPVTSPLYPWKRLGENVQLAFAASAEQKAQLQATFAVRRAQELQTLTATHPSSTMIPRLANDLNEDISSSLSVVVSGENGLSGVGHGHERGQSRGDHGAGITAGVGTEISSTAFVATATSEGMASTSVSVPASGSDHESNGAAGPLGVYCAAFNSSVSGVFIGHLEEGLTAHPGAFAEFNRWCAKNGSGAATTTVQQGRQQPSSEQPQGYQPLQEDGRGTGGSGSGDSGGGH